MNIIQRLFTKADPAFSLAQRYILGRPTWSKRDYPTYYDEGYKKNPIVYRCVGTISKSLAAIPLYIQDGQGEEITDHPVLDLLKKPNPAFGGARFFETLTAFHLLTGNGYIVAIGEGDEMAPRNPSELWNLRPDRMAVIPEKGGVGGYEYMVNGNKKNWTADPIADTSPILHWKAFHPNDDLYGMAPMEAAACAADQHNDASGWNKALLENSGQPSGAFVTGSGGNAVLTDAQRERLKAKIEERVSGSKNAGKPMILEGGLDWKQFSLSPREMDWINGKNISAREIAVVFGVPTQLVGIPGESTYANYQEARMAFYEETVLPLLDSLLDELNGWLLPMFDGLEGARICYDVDSLPALASKRQMLWTMVKDANFLSVNEKRKQLGFDELDLPEADEIFIPTGLLPLKGSLGDPTSDNAPEGMPADQTALPYPKTPAA